MSTNLAGGIDYTAWQPYSATTTNSSSSLPVDSGADDYYYYTYDNDEYVSSNSTSQETCTDGKDDGKIGIFSALYNTAKGAVKTATSAVKGMFTDSEGNFSLGKTLLSAGTIAVSCAVPAVGLTLCAVGAVSGAVTVGKGVYNACTADTDAEAKEAWQNIGGGALTTAVSVAGAKGSLNAVKGSSTAVDGLESLEEGASITQKAIALFNDMKSSTVNRASTISEAAVNLKNNFKSKGTNTETLNNTNFEVVNSSEFDVVSDVAYEEVAPESNLPANLQTDLATLENNSTTELASINNNAETSLNTYLGKEQYIDVDYKEIEFTNKEKLFNFLNSLFDSIKNSKESLGNLSSSAQEVFNTLKTGGYDEAVKQYGYETVTEVLNVILGSGVSQSAV